VGRPRRRRRLRSLGQRARLVLVSRGADPPPGAHSRRGVEKDVELVETDERTDAVDAAYDQKYGRRYPTIVPSIVAPQARAATLRLVPR